MPQLSAVLIVKNEADHLDACLAAVQSAVGEIVVVDTGSEDNTVSIAKKYTDKVFHFEWCDDFAAARNAALSHATGEWCLTLDADEVVQNPAAARNALTQFTANHSSSTLGTIEIESVFGDEGLVTIDHTRRFFHRESYRYTGAIHEQLEAYEGRSEQASTGLRVIHSGYAQSHDDPAHKAHRNIPIIQQCIEAHPLDEYYRYQLGVAYFSLKDYVHAVEALEKAEACIDFTKSNPTGVQGQVSREVLTTLLTTLGYSYINTGQLEKACNELERHVGLGHPGTRRADFTHALGYAYLMLGEIENAQMAFEASLDMGAEHEDVQGTGSYASHYHLGLLAEAKQDLAKALGHYAAALQMKPDYTTAISRCVDIVVEYKTPLPQALLDFVPASLWERIWLEKLDHHLSQGATDQATYLVETSSLVSPSLLLQCKAALQAYTPESKA